MLCAVVALLGMTLRMEPTLEALPEHRLVMGAHVGGGMWGRDPGMLLRPQLGYRGPQRTELLVSLPLQIVWPSNSSGRGTAGEAQVFNDWNDPETYAGLLEHLHLSFAGGALSIEAGPLRQATLGEGALVDELQGSPEPRLRRTGAQVALRLDSVRVEALVDSVVAPHVVGGHVSLAPLHWAGLDPEARFAVLATVAVDPAAPAGLPTDPTRTTPYGGGTLGASYDLWRGENIGLSIYGLAGVQSRPSVGGHLGLRFEAAEGVADPRKVLTLRVEGLASNDGYRGSPFDSMYEYERLGVPSRDDRPRASLTPRGGFGLRAGADVRLGGFRLSSSVRTSFRGELSSSLIVGLDVDPFSAQVIWIKRDMTEIGDLTTFEAGTYAAAEVSVRLWHGFFAYSTLARIPQVLGGGTVMRTDWFLGLGVATESG